MKSFNLESVKKALMLLINLLSIFLIGFVFIANLIRTCYISTIEVISFSSSYTYLLLIPVVLSLIYIYIYISKKYSAKLIFKVFSIAYIIAGAFIIFNTGKFIHGDASTVWNVSYKILHGDFSDLYKENYLGRYPYQLGLITYDLILHIFTNNDKILFTLNLLYVLIINWFGYKITAELFDNVSVSILVIFLEFAFLPQLFFIMFGYGTVPGFCSLIIAIYYCIRIYKSYNTKNMLFLILFSIISVLLKPNYKIGIMAMAIVVILKQSKTRKACFKYIFIAGVLLFSTVAAPKLLKLSYSRICNVEIGNGIPIHSWVAMGTDLDNQIIRGPGWYDGSTVKTYNDAGYDSSITSKMSLDKIKQNVKASLTDPKRAVSFYWRKITSTWCDPLFQSIWSGPGKDGKVSRHLQSLYCGWKAQKIVSLFSKAYVVIILAASLAFAILHKKQYAFSNLFYLYFIGGFIFHLFSETKSQYVYMYIFLLLPLTSYQLNNLAERIKALLIKKQI